jgi:hypothetical protein
VYLLCTAIWNWGWQIVSAALLGVPLLVWLCAALICIYLASEFHRLRKFNRDLNRIIGRGLRVAAIYDSPMVVGRIGDMLEGREISLPRGADGEQDGAVVARNLDLTNVVAKDEGEPPIKPAKKS